MPEGILSGRVSVLVDATIGAQVVAIDSPSRQRAIEHPTNYFGWILRGEALYQALGLPPPQARRKVQQLTNIDWIDAALAGSMANPSAVC